MRFPLLSYIPKKYGKHLLFRGRDVTYNELPLHLQCLDDFMSDSVRPLRTFNYLIPTTFTFAHFNSGGVLSLAIMHWSTIAVVALAWALMPS